MCSGDKFELVFPENPEEFELKCATCGPDEDDLVPVDSMAFNRKRQRLAEVWGGG